MFETPCTQALWEAVMGENRSEFRSPTRPVENVSWDDCEVFLKALNARIGDLELGLPSEAQWEYACRAGTSEVTYAGDLEILGDNNAPVLDAIAWYAGNCGEEFDLDDGWDISNWLERQYYAARKGGTHPVGQRLPNRWGLCDMLGNVWEWCADAWRADYARPIGGPEDAAAGRVIRGGSWGDGARVVRAASRLAYPPAIRIEHVGFRCAEFRTGRELQVGQERARSGAEPGAEHGSDRARASEAEAKKKKKRRWFR
jgi:formylglycine-generating enzyme required for sulfatase activity